jgi:hypothetical protein
VVMVDVVMMIIRSFLSLTVDVIWLTSIMQNYSMAILSNKTWKQLGQLSLL